jgi:hypothetical protein
MEEVAGGRRRLHNEELYNLYASLNIIWDIKLRRMKLEGHVARMGAYKNILTVKPQGKIPLGRPRHRWES